MAVGIDAANASLSTVQTAVAAIDEKLDMMALFRQLDSPAEKEIADYVSKNGGAKKCMQDAKALEDLKKLASKDAGQAKGSDEGGDLHAELEEDFDEAQAKNMVIYERKFEVQKRQLEEMLTSVVKREGDRIITSLAAGPHDRIIDQVRIDPTYNRLFCAKLATGSS